MPVIGFECHLCKVFIRNENDIKDHVISFQHLTVYQVILLSLITLGFVSVCNREWSTVFSRDTSEISPVRRLPADIISVA